MKSLTKSEEVYWVLMLKIHAGQEAEFRKTSAKLIASTEQESGCLNYEWSLSEDGATCHIYERYVDSAAVKIHRERNGAMVGELMKSATALSFTLYGSPSDEVKQLMAGRNPILMKPLGGFGR
jgi:quinol monooxygenase YgiN